MSALRILKRKEIVDALNVLMQADQLKFLRFTVSCEDLLKPEPFKVKQMYLLILEALYLGIGERLGQAHFAAGDMEHPAMFEDGIQRIRFMAVLGKTLADCGCEFQATDLFEPVTKRTVRNLSALINYLRFKHFVIGAVEYEHFVEGQEDLADNCERLKQENAQQELQIAELEHVRAQEEEVVAKLIEDIEQVDKETEVLKKCEEKHRKELEALHHQQDKLLEKAANAKSILKRHHEHIEDLSRKVVTCSPSKLKQEVADMRRLAEEAVRCNDEISGSVASYMNVTNAIQKLPPLLRGVDTTVDVLVKKEEQSAQRQQELHQIKEQVVSKQRKLQEMHQKQKSVCSRIKSLEQRLHQLSIKAKRLEGTGVAGSLQRDFELLEMEKKQMEKFKIKAKQELEALRLQMAELEREHSSKMAAISAAKENIAAACNKRRNLLTQYC